MLTSRMWQKSHLGDGKLPSLLLGTLLETGPARGRTAVQPAQERSAPGTSGQGYGLF